MIWKLSFHCWFRHHHPDIAGLLSLHVRSDWKANLQKQNPFPGTKCRRVPQALNHTSTELKLDLKPIGSPVYPPDGRMLRHDRDSSTRTPHLNINQKACRAKDIDPLCRYLLPLQTRESTIPTPSKSTKGTPLIGGPGCLTVRSP